MTVCVICMWLIRVDKAWKLWIPFQTSPKWHRLIGLRCTWKTLKPEILMFVTITDVVGVQIVNEMVKSSAQASFTFYFSIEQPDFFFISVEKFNICSHQKYADPTARHSHWIESKRTAHSNWRRHVGQWPVHCWDLLATMPMVELCECYWNNSLNPHTNETLISNQLTDNPLEEDSFLMRYTLLDCPTVERNLPKMFGAADEDRYMVHEKITIQLRSSLQMLRKYFESVFYIPIYIYCKEDIVGES